ncbi:hypothetical protein HK101_002238 [Irineochytrium annulatum]|nr:hypothetical protein HK101_002238 [Irineochytrium annulatum]
MLGRRLWMALAAAALAVVLLFAVWLSLHSSATVDGLDSNPLGANAEDFDVVLKQPVQQSGLAPVTVIETVTITATVSACPSPSLSSVASNFSASPLFLHINAPMHSRVLRLPHPHNIDSHLPPAPNTSTTTNTRRHSHHRCLGDSNHLSGYMHRICSFQNVCYNTELRRYHYYRRNNVPPRAVLFEADKGYLTDFETADHGFVALQQSIDLMGLSPEATFAPRMVEGMAPAAGDHERTLVLEQPHYLWESWAWDDNLGHALWEEMGTIWYGMVRLGFVWDDIVPMHGPLNLPDRPLAKKFREAFFPGISKAPPVDMDRYFESLIQAEETRRSAENHKGKHRKITNICFDNLLAGGNMRRYVQRTQWHNHGHEPLFFSLRGKILEHHGLDPFKLPTEHRIVITNKTDSNYHPSHSSQQHTHRSFYNLPQMVDHLRTKHPKVRLDVIEWHKLDIKEQLEVLTSTTLLITPAGGVSMMMPFLPEGAHAIILDYLEKEDDGFLTTWKGQSVSMESPFWNHWPHFRKQYYQVRDRSQLRPDDPPNEIAPGKNPDGLDDVIWRDSASVVVDMGTLDGLVDHAFEDMAP